MLGGRGGDRAGGEKQRITGEKGSDHEAGFAKDDEEKDGVDPRTVLRRPVRKDIVEMQNFV